MTCLFIDEIKEDCFASEISFSFEQPRLREGFIQFYLAMAEACTEELYSNGIFYYDELPVQYRAIIRKIYLDATLRSALNAFGVIEKKAG